MNKYERRAGILLHITSLPSRYGIGDLGPEARRFADFLAETGASYWQILPLNPIDAAAGYSPYSSSSSIAGNPLLISPDLLRDEHLLIDAELKNHRIESSVRVDFERAESGKFGLLELAWARFRKMKKGKLHSSFDNFCSANAAWLNAFATFTAIRNDQAKKEWFDWPATLAKAEPKAIKSFSDVHEEELQKIKWFQFIFFRQWDALRQYCHQKGIGFVGDLPFYVSHDSVDVWQNRRLFKVDSNGKMKGIAGVPPDYFNEDGQLWMMPTYDWSVMKKNRYRWWKNRLDHNLQLFDVLRLDHFRAFADYWEVPGGALNAKKGKWKDGPGLDFFDGSINVDAFLAEDLGDLSQAVLDLRDALHLPGMKVLQFSFGDDVANSVHAPHTYSPNFFAYTGTHDNNTMVGWYNEEGKPHKKQIEKYIGKKITAKNVSDELSRLVMASVARVAILPLQDLLGLDQSNRLNDPGGNMKDTWKWQLLPDQVKPEHAAKLNGWISIYGRGKGTNEKGNLIGNRAGR